MKIICKESTSKNFDLTEIKTVFVYNYNYPITLDEEYLVMGLAIYKDSPCLYYLTDEGGSPWWYPYPLFEISDPKIPNNWYVEVNEKTNRGDIHFLSGFYELCCNPDYYDALTDREQWAMEIYFKRKAEAEKAEKGDLL